MFCVDLYAVEDPSTACPKLGQQILCSFWCLHVYSSACVADKIRGLSSDQCRALSGSSLNNGDGYTIIVFLLHLVKIDAK
jgi:hypothetical protein